MEYVRAIEWIRCLAPLSPRSEIHVLLLRSGEDEDEGRVVWSFLKSAKRVSESKESRGGGGETVKIVRRTNENEKRREEKQGRKLEWVKCAERCSNDTTKGKKNSVETEIVRFLISGKNVARIGEMHISIFHKCRIIPSEILNVNYFIQFIIYTHHLIFNI